MPNDAKQQIQAESEIYSADVNYWPQATRVRAAELTATETKFWNNHGEAGESRLPWGRISRGRLA